MKVSLNTVKQFTDVDLSADELVAKINSQLGAVEEIINLTDVYKDALIVKVVECEKHPAADRLNITKIDDGGITEGIERDENGLIQVVCGAPNVYADMFAVWLPPQSVVPSSYHDEEPFVLGARELRGILSQGMLAAADELGIGSDHEGILVIDLNEWKPNDVEIKPGASFAAAYGLDDTIIDIENKMFTHRPDLFGQLGVAREIAGIQQKQFVSPDWYLNTPEFKDVSGLELTTFNDANEKVPRAMFVALKDVEIKPSPLWLQAALVAMGAKPINNIVDVTNYVMLLTAQPTHAYDYDKIRGATIGARMAQAGETVELLNGKTYELTEDDIVIADAEGPIGLGGIMGGGNSEVSADTKNIILEVANFNMYAVRKSSMRHGVFTDALTRFNKGQSSLQNGIILNLLINSIFDVAGGTQASEVSDLGNYNVIDKKPLLITPTYLMDRLGVRIENEAIKTMLGNVEFEISEHPLTSDISSETSLNDIYGQSNETMTQIGLYVSHPFWRTDIELPEDIVEEVGRLYGFDKLPNELPRRPIQPAAKTALIERKSYVRKTLSGLGANEVLTYSFVHEKLLEKAGQNAEHAYRVSNALSPDLKLYRLSLTPSLLDKVHMNIKNRFDAFSLFEINKTHFKGEMDEYEPSVPNEDNHVAAVIAYNDKTRPDGSAFYLAKRYLQSIIAIDEETMVPLSQIDLEQDAWAQQLVASYAPDRTAVILRDNQVYGVIGEFKESVRKAFKLPSYVAGFEIHSSLIRHNAVPYSVLSRFPGVTQDVSLEVDSSMPVSAVTDVAHAVLEELDFSWSKKLSVAAIYQAAGSDMKTITLRLTVANYERSLLDKDVSQLLDTIAAEVSTRLPRSI
jgi:phenylalanyl-tRNA synthetase beta chain